MFDKKKTIRSLRWNKTRILQSRRGVRTVFWLHYKEFNEVLGDKPKWEPHGDAACYFEQMLEAEPHKTAAVR